MINDRYAALIAHQDSPYVVIARELEYRLPPFLKAPITEVVHWLGNNINITGQILDLVGKYHFGKIYQLIFRRHIALPVMYLSYFLLNIVVFGYEIQRAKLDIDQLRDKDKDLALQFDRALLDSVFGRSRRYPAG